MPRVLTGWHRLIYAGRFFIQYPYARVFVIGSVGANSGNGALIESNVGMIYILAHSRRNLSGFTAYLQPKKYEFHYSADGGKNFAISLNVFAGTAPYEQMLFGDVTEPSVGWCVSRAVPLVGNTQVNVYWTTNGRDWSPRTLTAFDHVNFRECCAPCHNGTECYVQIVDLEPDPKSVMLYRVDVYGNAASQAIGDADPDPEGIGGGYTKMAVRRGYSDRVFLISDVHQKIYAFDWQENALTEIASGIVNWYVHQFFPTESGSLLALDCNIKFNQTCTQLYLHRSIDGTNWSTINLTEYLPFGGLPYAPYVAQDYEGMLFMPLGRYGIISVDDGENWQTTAEFLPTGIGNILDVTGARQE